LGGKWTALIRDLNFNPLPSNISFKADADRQYGESHLRKFNSDDLDLPPTFNKYFNMSRNYALKYEPAKSITVDFNATNLSRIDEPYGRIDTKAKQDTIIQHIEQLKRTVNYNQTCNVNYNLPFSKIPLLDWITSRATYGATYTWTTAPLAYTTLGNTIQNTQNEQLNGEFNFNNLYNKIGFLKRYNTKTLLQQSTADKGKEDPNKKEDLKKDDKNAKPKIDKKQKKKDEPRLNPVVYTILKPLMSLKRITANISEDNGTVLPGYMRSTRFLGMDSIWNQPGF
jgi:cell surface protein SprA